MPVLLTAEELAVLDGRRGETARSVYLRGLLMERTPSPFDPAEQIRDRVAETQRLRAQLRRAVRRLTQDEAFTLARSWVDMGHEAASLAKQEWVKAQIGCWSQSMMTLMAMELAAKMLGRKPR